MRGFEELLAFFASRPADGFDALDPEWFDDGLDGHGDSLVAWNRERFMLCRVRKDSCDSLHVRACVGSQQEIAGKSKSSPISQRTREKGRARWNLQGGRKDPAALLSTLSPVVSVVVTVIVAIAAISRGVVGLAVSALVAFAILVFVAALVAHPVLVAAGVFPIVGFKLEAA